MAARLQIQGLINRAEVLDTAHQFDMASDIPEQILFFSFGEKHAVCAQKAEETHLETSVSRAAGCTEHRC